MMHVARRSGHVQLLEERKRLPEELRGASSASLTSSCHFEAGLRQERPCQFRAQFLAPCYGLGSSQVSRRIFPPPILQRDHTQHTIHQEPVVLTAKGEQRRIEPHRTLVVTQR